MTVAIRAIGPDLGHRGVRNPLQDPVLSLFAGSTIVASNDDWPSAPNAEELRAIKMAPPDDRESAIMTELEPGAYTAIVRGHAGIRHWVV